MRSEGGAGMVIWAAARAAVAQGPSRQGGDNMDQRPPGYQYAPQHLSVHRRPLVRPGCGRGAGAGWLDLRRSVLMAMRILLADDHVKHRVDGHPSCLVRVV